MTNAEARFNKSLRPRKPEGSFGRTAQDGHLDSHTAPVGTLTFCASSVVLVRRVSRRVVSGEVLVGTEIPGGEVKRETVTNATMSPSQ